MNVEEVGIRYLTQGTHKGILEYRVILEGNKGDPT